MIGLGEFQLYKRMCVCLYVDTICITLHFFQIQFSLKNIHYIPVCVSFHLIVDFLIYKAHV